MSTDWKTYDSFINAEITGNNLVTGFSEEEAYWNALCKIEMPPMCEADMLTLPLHIHLSRGEELGIDISSDECSKCSLPQLNLFWAPSRIIFKLVGVTEHKWPQQIGGLPLAEIRRKIWSLHRDSRTGKMAGKEIRREIFLAQLIGKSNISPSTYDIWFFDLIGQQSQGCCIDRQSRTVIMGRRSTKGYEVPTDRPLACLAKTMAHELGHALGLGHPQGRHFSDGTSCVAATGRNNLMIGGTDVTGGGGEGLCPWQVLVARRHAAEFLADFPDEEIENGKVAESDDFYETGNIEGVVVEREGGPSSSSSTPPVTQRTVTQQDALQWLGTFADEQLPGEVFTSIPDISELDPMFSAPHKYSDNYELYKKWFRDAVALVLAKTPHYAIFLQTDIRALVGNDDQVLEFIDKSALIQEVAKSCKFTLVWHKVVTNSERPAQKRVSHSPNWSHLLCLRRQEGSKSPCYPTRKWKTPDVFPRGDMTWERAVGLHAAMTGVSFLKHMALATTVVDPFCGLGTVLAVANALDLDSVGNDLSRKRAKRAAALDLRYAMCCVPPNHREHYGVTERLSYSKDSVPKPHIWRPEECSISDSNEGA